MADDTERVRRGYDQLSHRYRADDDDPVEYRPWIARLCADLPVRARVLDVGCGCGVPVARELSAAGLEVTGVDVSGVQIERARRLVPGATFVQDDIRRVDFPAGSFEAVIALYSIIHVPLADQPDLLARWARWLVDDGVFLLVAGERAYEGSEPGWLGGDTEMWWSQTDAATYARWLEQAGLRVRERAFVPEADGGHSLFWADRIAPGQPI